MPQDNELDLKFLERSLQQEEGARKVFFRDLKIATVLLLAFQFMVFFVFIDLNDQRLALELQVTQLRADQKALSEVQAQLVLLEDFPQEVEKQVKGAPAALRQQISELAQL